MKLQGKNDNKKLMKDHPCLSFRIPEATSMNRTTSLNMNNVYRFFDNYEKILNEFKLMLIKFMPNVFGLSTVYKLSKIIAKKRKHLVGIHTSDERGLMTTGVFCLNAMGKFQPAMLI